MNALFADCFAIAAPDTPALVSGTDRLTYGELRDRAERVAAGLWTGGVRPGDRVAGIYRYHPDVITVVLACARLGAVYVPIEWEHAAAQVRAILERIEPAAIFLEERYLPALTGALALVGDQRIFLSAAGAAQPLARLDDLDGPRGALPDTIDQSAPGLMPFTSGSTGRAKGVMLDWRALRCELRMGVRGFRLGPADRVLATAGMDSSCAFFDMILGTLAAGGTAHQAPFDAAEVPRLIERERITMWGGGPAQVRAVVEAQRAVPADLSSLRLIWVGGDRATTALREQALAVFGRPIVDHYGITEAGICMAAPHEARPDKLGSCGTPWPGVEVRLIDDEGRDVAVGEPGEFLFRSGTIMMGYWRDPEATAAALRGGWYHTGDIGRVDADGFHWFIGRRGDTIKRDTGKISALEVESAIEQHDDVLAAGVIGVPDGDMGEKVRAYVVPRAGHHLEVRLLDSFLGERIGEYWRPEEYELVAELPRTPAGKVDRGRLREMAGLSRQR